MSLDTDTPETSRGYRGYHAEARAAVRELEASQELVRATLAAHAALARKHEVLNLTPRFGRKEETPDECVANWLEFAFDDADLIDSDKLEALRAIAEGE